MILDHDRDAPELVAERRGQTVEGIDDHALDIVVDGRSGPREASGDDSRSLSVGLPDDGFSKLLTECARKVRSTQPAAAGRHLDG